jgi:tetratricopeptide (TPR) repeat protein
LVLRFGALYRSSDICCWYKFFEPAGCLDPAAPKEKNMKRTISLWLGLLAFAILPVLAQTPNGPTGKIHGHVTTPTGVPAPSGTVSLSNDGGRTSKYTYPVSSAGEFSGEAAPGTYTIVYRQADTPPEKMVDYIDNVKVVVGQDVLQDMDMSRKDFIDKLSTEQKKQLDELKKHNSEAMKANEVIKVLNADLLVAAKDIKDVDSAAQTARQALGAAPTRANLEAKEAEIKVGKYTEVETLMLKDTAAKPDASVLWMRLGQAQLGLKKYDEAEASFKKALELDAASKKPNVQVQGTAQSGLGEIYARAGKVPEANTAYDAAAKVDPASAGLYLKNEAVIFSIVGNSDAQVAAADEAIKLAPTQSVPYYLKGQGLILKATVDASGRYVLPPGCAEAYQKYLELDPNGQYAADVKGILSQAATKVDTTYKAPKTKK